MSKKWMIEDKKCPACGFPMPLHFASPPIGEAIFIKKDCGDCDSRFMFTIKWVGGEKKFSINQKVLTLSDKGTEAYRAKKKPSVNPADKMGGS